MIEYIAVGLAVIAGISATTAFIYRKGKSDGMDSQCERRIKQSINDLGKKVDKNATDSDKVHGELFSNIKEIGSKMDKLQGSSDVIKDLITQHITKQD